MARMTKQDKLKNTVNEAMRQAAELLGEEVPDIDIEKIESRKWEESQALNGSLHFAHYIHDTMNKKCARCGNIFTTNYCYVGYCSVECKKTAFFERYNIRWDDIATPQRPAQDRLEENFIIPPLIAKRMYEWAKECVARYESLSQEELQGLEQEEDTLIQSTELASQSPEFSFDLLTAEIPQFSLEEEDSNPPATHLEPLDTLDSPFHIPELPSDLFQL